MLIQYVNFTCEDFKEGTVQVIRTLLIALLLLAACGKEGSPSPGSVEYKLNECKQNYERVNGGGKDRAREWCERAFQSVTNPYQPGNF